MEHLATLSHVTPGLFGATVTYFDAKLKKAITSGENIDDVDKYCLKKDCDLLRISVINWHSQKSHSWRHTWQFSNTFLFEKFKPVLPELYRLAESLGKKSITFDEAFEIADQIGVQLLIVKPDNRNASFTNWFKLNFLVDMFRDRYAPKGTVVTAMV